MLCASVGSYGAPPGHNHTILILTVTVECPLLFWRGHKHKHNIDNKQLLSKTTELNNRDYIVRMLYKDAY